MFFKRIFKKPPPPKPVETLSLRDLRGRIRELKHEKLAETQSELNALLDRVSEARETTLGAVETLSKAETTEVIHPGLYKSALEARRLLVDKMNRSLVSFSRPKEITVDVLTSIDERLKRLVNFTTSALATHGRHVRMLFGPQLNTLQLHIRHLHALIREVHALIEKTLNRTRSLDSLLSKVESQIELANQIDVMRSKSEQLIKQATELEKLIENNSIKLAQFMESEEFKRVGSLKDEIQQIEQEITRVKDAVVSTFLSISRPLRKMEKLVADRKYEMNRELEIILKLCIQDPLAIISSDEKISATQSVLQRMSDLLEKGEIDLSERERVKRIEMVQEIMRDEKIKKFKKRLEELQKEREDRLRVWEQLPHLRKSELEQSIEKRRSNLKNVRTRIEELTRKLESTWESIEKNRAELERLASEMMGAQIRLTS
jgi:hypothetical protein